MMQLGEQIQCVPLNTPEQGVNETFILYVTYSQNKNGSMELHAPTERLKQYILAHIFCRS